MTPTLERSLVRRWKRGDMAAREKLARYAMTLVPIIAARVGGSASRDDLESAGHEGLAQAFERFKPRRSPHFITYASRWIMGCMLTCAREQASVVHLPREQYGNHRWAGLRRAAERASLLLGEPPYSEAVATMLARAYDSTPAQVQRRLLRPEADAPIDDAQPSAAPSPEDEALAREDRERMGVLAKRALAILSPVDEIVIRAMLADDPPTDAALGARLGVTHQAIALRRKRALAKMRKELEQ